MSSTPMTEEQRQETLKSLGLNPDAPGLATVPAKVALLTAARLEIAQVAVPVSMRAWIAAISG